MKIVVDTNRIMAAMLKDGTTREILILSCIEFVTHEHAIEELIKHKEYISGKFSTDKIAFDILFQVILQYIAVIPKELIKQHNERAKEIMKDIDIEDFPFIACALATNADGIWSHDSHFSKQIVVKTYTNSDLRELLKK